MELQSLAGRLDNLLSSAERIAASLETELPEALSSASRAAGSVTELAERTTESMDEVDALIAELRSTAAVVRDIGERLSANSTPALDRVLETLTDAAQELGRLAETLASNPSQLLRGRSATPRPGEE